MTAEADFALISSVLRRAAGWTWRAIAAESGQPASWLRRQAAAAARTHR